MKKKSPRAWRELLERLQTIQLLLTAVLEAMDAGHEWSDLPHASALLKQLKLLAVAVPRSRPEIAAYIDDVEAFARHVLGELLTARTRRLH
jgi:hypothetical protein